MRLPYAFRISLRSLLRSPILFASAVIALGLGIAAPTTMFTIADGVLSELPVPAPEGLVHIGATNPRFSSGLRDHWCIRMSSRRRTSPHSAALSCEVATSQRATWRTRRQSQS